MMFIDPGVKINAICYCGVFLSQQLLSATRQIGSAFILPQDGFPVFSCYSLET